MGRISVVNSKRCPFKMYALLLVKRMKQPQRCGLLLAVKSLIWTTLTTYNDYLMSLFRLVSVAYKMCHHILLSKVKILD